MACPCHRTPRCCPRFYLSPHCFGFCQACLDPADFLFLHRFSADCFLCLDPEEPLGRICPAPSLCWVEPSDHSCYRHRFPGFVCPLLAPLGVNYFGCLRRLYLDPFAAFAHAPTAAPRPGSCL